MSIMDHVRICFFEFKERQDDEKTISIENMQGFISEGEKSNLSHVYCHVVHLSIVVFKGITHHYYCTLRCQINTPPLINFSIFFQPPDLIRTPVY